MSRALALGTSLALAFAVAGLGSFFTTPAIDSWYAFLIKPELAPPNWVFGPVWSALYAMMAVAAYLVWQKTAVRRSVQKTALALYALQLSVNLLWSYAFFTEQNIGLALGVIVVLWLLIVATMYAFYKISRPAALLLVPYLVWVSFASYLNYTLWVLNG